jgi:hypothetical protein
VCKRRHTTQGEFGVSYSGVARPARNGNCLAGLEEGAQRRARGSISDFATLVRKSYSDSLSLVSTLVLPERTYYSARGFGSGGNFSDDPFPWPEFHEAARG